MTTIKTRRTPADAPPRCPLCAARDKIRAAELAAAGEEGLPLADRPRHLWGSPPPSGRGNIGPTCRSVPRPQTG